MNPFELLKNSQAIKEQAENFLRAHGVTDEMMDRIRAVLLEN